MNDRFMDDIISLNIILLGMIDWKLGYGHNVVCELLWG